MSNEETHLIEIKELAKILDCSVSGINLKLKTDDYFPRPIPSNGRSVRKWRRCDIDEYIGRKNPAEWDLQNLPPQLVQLIRITVTEAVDRGLNNFLNTPR